MYFAAGPGGKFQSQGNQIEELRQWEVVARRSRVVCRRCERHAFHASLHIQQVYGRIGAPTAAAGVEIHIGDLYADHIACDGSEKIARCVVWIVVEIHGWKARQIERDNGGRTAARAGLGRKCVPAIAQEHQQKECVFHKRPIDGKYKTGWSVFAQQPESNGIILFIWPIVVAIARAALFVVIAERPAADDAIIRGA